MCTILGVGAHTRFDLDSSPASLIFAPLGDFCVTVVSRQPVLYVAVASQFQRMALGEDRQGIGLSRRQK
jgi:hypothetical protein